MTVYTMPQDSLQNSSGHPTTTSGLQPTQPFPEPSHSVTTNDLFVLFQELLHSTKHSPNQAGMAKFPIELPKFYGRPNESLAMWLFQVESAFATRSIFGTDRMPYLSTCLGEAALSWLHNWHTTVRAASAHTFISWDEFVMGIRQAFEPPRQQQLLRTQLRGLKQTSSAQAYTFAFRSLMGQITHMHEEDRLSYYLHGLANKLRSEVEVREPKDLEDAIKMAVTYDQIRQSSQPIGLISHNDTFWQRPLPPVVPKSSKVQLANQVAPMELGSISRKSKQHRDKSRTPEYFSKYCNKCPRYGHTDAECRTHPSPEGTTRKINLLQDESQNFTSLESEKALSMGQNYLCQQNGKPNDLIIFDGLINNHKARVLLDSGASYDYISADFVREKKIQTESTSPRNVVIADGTPHKTDSVIKNANLTIGHLHDQVSLHVFPLTTCDVILGKPFLFRHNPFIDWRSNTVEIAGENGVIVLRTEKNLPACRTNFPETVMIL